MNVLRVGLVGIVILAAVISPSLLQASENGEPDITGYKQYQFGTPIENIFEYPNHYWSLEQTLGVSQYTVEEQFDLTRYSFHGFVLLHSLARKPGQGSIDAIILPIYQTQLSDANYSENIDMFSVAMELYNSLKQSYADELVVTDSVGRGTIKLILVDEQGDGISLVFDGTRIEIHFESSEYRQELTDPHHRNR